MTDKEITLQKPEEQQMDFVELSEAFVVLSIPEQAVSLEISATVWTDDGPLNVKKTMNFQEIRAAIKDAEENYIPEDAIFVLTDKGRADLEQLRMQNGEELI